MTRNSGSEEMDQKLLAETREELSRGWAGTFALESFETGPSVSRHFPLMQCAKTRMIDDFERQW